MHNHLHLLLETPQPNLAEGMRWFLGVYTTLFNLRQKEFGHLFDGRYQARLVDGSGNGCLKTVCDYVHLSPVRAKLLAADQGLLLAQVREAARPEHRGAEVRESAAAKAESLLREEPERLGWSAEQLVARRKGDPQKLRIGQRLRQETTMTLAWVAARLQMGVPSHLACLPLPPQAEGSPRGDQ